MSMNPSKEKRVIPQTLSFVDEDMFLLCTCAGKYYLIRYQGDEPQEVIPVASSMWLSTAFLASDGKPAVMLATRSGMTQLVQSGKRSQKIQIPTAGTGPGSKRGYIGYMTTFQNTPYIQGYSCQVYRFDGRTWQTIDKETSGIREMIFDSGMIEHQKKLMLLFSKKGSEHNLFAFDGNTWEVIHTGEDRFNCLTVHANNIYLAGGSNAVIAMIDNKGKMTPVTVAAEKEFYPWSASSFEGELILSDHHSVKALRGTELVDLGAPTDPKYVGSSHNTCLYATKDRLYFARCDGVFVFQNKAWHTLLVPKELR